MILPGKVLKEAREKGGLTQAQLAQRLSVSQPVIARLESGRSNPKLDTFLKAIATTGHDLRVQLESSGWPHIDETMIREALNLSPTERLGAFQASYRGARSIASAALNSRGT